MRLCHPHFTDRKLCQFTGTSEITHLKFCLGGCSKMAGLRTDRVVCCKDAKLFKAI